MRAATPGQIVVLAGALALALGPWAAVGATEEQAEPKIEVDRVYDPVER